MALEGKKFDMIYLDMGAGSKEVLEAAVLAFPLLKGRGMLIFDDYTTDKYHANSCPKPGIDAFLGAYAQDVKVVHATWQLVCLKRTKPLKRVACKSEYYHEDIRTI